MRLYFVNHFKWSDLRHPRWVLWKIWDYIRFGPWIIMVNDEGGLWLSRKRQNKKYIDKAICNGDKVIMHIEDHSVTWIEKEEKDDSDG